ncbi:scarecrow-like protein 31 [Miscanthus floridulus]|uniref:scarecrow-like protein 31 n=1 Tax=Miscanthus floridulus TaxID=154761 RepID=UPI00345A0BB4
MAATPEDVAEPESFSPSVFLDLPPTPHPQPDGDGEDLQASSDDMVLPFIRRMLMEEEEDTDDNILYQQYPDHPALLLAQQPFAQILSAGSIHLHCDTHARRRQRLCFRTRSGTGAGLDGFTGGDANNSFSSPGQGSASACGQARAFFNGGDTATIQSSSLGDGVGVTMDMLNQAFLKGMEEANKFLPTTAIAIIGLDGDATSKENLPIRTAACCLVVSGRGCKNRHNWDDLDDDAETGRRSNKLLAPEPEENSEQVDDVFVKGYEMAIEKMHGLSISNNNGSAPDGKAKRKSAAQANEAVDLRTLLTHCAEAVSTGSRRIAAELLRQIRQRSSPRGDASQRLAHCLDKRRMKSRRDSSGFWRQLLRSQEFTGRT